MPPEGSEPTLATPDQIAALDAGTPPDVTSGSQVTDETGGAQAQVPEQSGDGKDASPPSLSLVQAAKALGFAIPEDAVDDQVASAIRQLQGYANLGRQFKTNPQQFASFIQSAQPQPQVTQPAPTPEASQQADPLAWPELDPKLAELCIIDEETGMARPRHDLVPQTVVQRVNQYLHERERLNEAFAKNPIKFTYERLKEPILNEVREYLRQEFEAQKYESQKTAFEKEITDKYYATDGNGTYLRDPATGDFAVSPWGQQYLQAMEMAAQMGATDELMIAQFAAQQADRLTPPPQAKPVQTPAQVSQQKKEAFLAGTTPGTGYAASNQSVNEPTNGYNLGQLENLFTERARAAGYYTEVN